MSNKTVVTVRGASLKGERIDGDFPLVRADNDFVIIAHPKHGKLKISQRLLASPIPASQPTALTYDELVKDIKGRFDVLDRLTNGIVEGKIRSLVVSGAPGVGKTHSIETRLRAAKRAGEIEDYVTIRGTLSPIGLYALLYQNREEGSVILLDDTDSAFEQLDVVNILKAALDTGKRRVVSYVKEAYALKNEGIPQRFEYKGSIIFISNIDFDGAVASGSKMSPHLNALMSRSIYVDLGLHSQQALLARIENVCRETSMLRDLDLNDDQVEELIQWVKDNAPNLRSLSLRTALQLASLITTDENWKDVAKVTMLRARRR